MVAFNGNNSIVCVQSSQTKGHKKEIKGIRIQKNRRKEKNNIEESRYAALKKFFHCVSSLLTAKDIHFLTHCRKKGNHFYFLG